MASSRHATARAAAMSRALEHARENPYVYVLPGDEDAKQTAERCAVAEAAMQLHLPETVVRELARTADAAQQHLPQLWHAATEGFVAWRSVEDAVGLLHRFTGHPAETLGAFDEALASWVMTLTPAGLRRRARKLAERLTPTEPEVAHEQARAERQVVVEQCENGMSWLAAYLPTQDALAIKSRLTATAKHLDKRARAGRTRDQIRADLFSAWLRGVGTPTAVKTKVFVTVPADALTPAAQKTVRGWNRPEAGDGTDCGETDTTATIDIDRPDRVPTMLGGDDLDRSTAIRLLLEAGKFTRVITDPVTGVVLDMDRRSRTVTPQQREWLMLTHGRCTRDGCDRPAIDTEIDHFREYRHGGVTNIVNLHPFCEPDHKLKGTTRFRYRQRDDGSTVVSSPTGFTTKPERLVSPRLAALLRKNDRRLAMIADPPPF